MPKGRPRKYHSWDNEQEIHPFVRFPKKDNNARYLVLGSFPPNKFTTYRQRLVTGDVDFFYGSKENSFWDLFLGALEIQYKWPVNNDKIKSWLEASGWIFSDILLKVSRRRDSASDSDLIAEEWNIQEIRSILSSNPIETILFTSKWVAKNFRKNIQGKFNEVEYKFEEIILISPSPAGLISTDWAKKLIPSFENESSTAYRRRYYRQVLSNCKG